MKLRDKEHKEKIGVQKNERKEELNKKEEKNGNEEEKVKE